MPSAGQRMVLADLREQVGRRLNGAAMSHRVTLPFGVPALDRHLPGGGLARGVLHEIVEAGPAAEFAGAATLFAAGIAARLKGPVIWCLTRRDLFAPGLAAAGLHPDRVIYVEAGRDSEVLPLDRGRPASEGPRRRRRRGHAPQSHAVPPAAARRGGVGRHGAGASTLVDACREGTDGFADRRRHPLADRACPVGRSAGARYRPAAMAGRSRALPRRRSLFLDLEACDAKGRLAVPADLADRSHPSARRRAAAWMSPWSPSRRTDRAGSSRAPMRSPWRSD